MHQRRPVGAQIGGHPVDNRVHQVEDHSNPVGNPLLGAAHCLGVEGHHWWVAAHNLDWWSLGCTAAILAWATLAEPRLRPNISTAGWDDVLRRDNDVNCVAPRGTTLRPVLDMLLHHDPEERSSRPVDFSLLGGAHETPSLSQLEEFGRELGVWS